MKNKAFTLIELLVTITIIAILIALLLNGLAGVIQEGRKIKCSANLHSIGQAAYMYALDNGEYVPREAGLRYEHISWPMALRKYVEKIDDIYSFEYEYDQFVRAEAFRDPSRPEDDHNIHYVNNGFRFDDVGEVSRFTQHESKLVDVRSPSVVIYFTGFADDPNRVINRMFGFSPNNRRTALFYDAHETTHLIHDPIYDFVPLNKLRVSVDRHAGIGSNALFFDGHVNFVGKKEIVNLNLWDDGDRRPTGF